MKKLTVFYMIRLFLLSGFIFIFSFELSSQNLNPASWPHLKGYWKFQDISKLTKATVGNDLVLVGTHSVVAGPAFGDTAIRIGIGSYYRCKHNIPPNGGGDSVNRYTLMFDFKVLNFDRWHTFFQTDSTNMNDGECFIRPNTGTNPGCIGTATTKYTLNPINPKQWYRLIISVNLDHFYRYYLNGSLVLDGDTQYVDKRFALTKLILFFADNDGEDDTIDVASVAIFDTCLSSADIAKIGSIDPCVANPPHVNLGADTTLCSYNSIIKNAGTGFKKYQWSSGDTIASVTFNTKKLAMGFNKVWAKVTDVNGCTAIDTVNITFSAPPVVNLGKDTAFCQGGSAKLTAGTNNTYHYLWLYLPKGDTLSILKTITVDSAGKYAAVVTSSIGCVSKDTIQIIINPNPPKPVITVTGKTSFCAGDSVKLQGPAGYPVYIWSNGAKLSYSYISKNSILTLKVKDSKNCVSPFSDSVVVNVFPLPVVPVILITGDSIFCDGDSAILSGPPGYTFYNWSNGVNTRKQTVKTNGKYSLNVTDSNGCNSRESAKKSIKVFPLPPKPIITVTGLTSFCDGDSVILSVTAGLMQIHWQDGNGNTSRTEKQSGLFSVYFTDANSCASPVSDTVAITVYNNPPKPVITITGDTIFCQGENAQLSAPAGYADYLWSDSSKTQDIVVDTTGSFSVRVESNHGCISSWSDSINLLVYPLPPKPQVLLYGKDSLHCNIPAEHYYWYRNGILLPDTVRNIYPGQSGYFQVKVREKGCLSKISDSLNYHKSGINELSGILPGLKIYPDPVTSEALISITNLEGQGDVWLNIMDIHGKKVWEGKTSVMGINSGVRVNMHDMCTGVYLVKVITFSRIYTARIEKL